MKRSREEMEGALLLQLTRQEVHTTPLSAPCTPAWSDLADVLGEEGEEEGSYRSMSPLALPETSFSASKPETKPGKGKGSKAESGKQQRVSDARRAELFLTHVRESENPCGEAFRALVASINESTRSSSDTYGMKAFDARPKYVLRKLCFSILPVKPREREEFIHRTLSLTHVPTEQRLFTKQDAFEVLVAVCDVLPDVARIPKSLRSRQ